jgi:hypothetical protein
MTIVFNSIQTRLDKDPFSQMDPSVLWLIVIIIILAVVWIAFGDCDRRYDRYNRFDRFID